MLPEPGSVNNGPEFRLLARSLLAAVGVTVGEEARPNERSLSW
jgi:hypothetical protein